MLQRARKVTGLYITDSNETGTRVIDVLLLQVMVTGSFMLYHGGAERIFF